MPRKWFTRIVIALAAVFIAVQSVPYGRDHSNPPRRIEPRWDSAATRELARRACFDCHSNETVWPAYANVAPVSWLVQHDVDEGRAMLNFSEWDRPQEEAGEAADVIADGEMPPSMYALMHRTARLDAGETQQLMQGLARTIGNASGHADED
jgi:hypothetical protein